MDSNRKLRRKVAYGLATLAAGGTAAGLVGGITSMASADTTTEPAASAASATAASAGPADRPARGGAPRPNGLAAAAGVLGMSEADLRTALQGGTSIADVAGERDVDLQEVIDAIVAAETKALDESVAAGRLTQAQADQKKAGLAAHVTEHVNRAGLGGGKGGPGGSGGPGGGGRAGAARGASLSAAAGALGMSEADLRTALQGGTSIADVAGGKGVDLQEVIDAIVAAETKALDESVAAGRLTQAEADQKKAGLAARVAEHVNRAGPAGGKRGPGAAPAPPTTTATPASVQLD